MADTATNINGNTELIEFLQGHFTKIDGQFEGVREQFEGVREQFEGVNEQFEGVNERIDGLVSTTSARFVEMNEKLERMDKRIDGLYTLIDSFITLHQKLDIELTALRDKYNHLSRAHNGLANEHRELTTRVARLEGTPA